MTKGQGDRRPPEIRFWDYVDKNGPGGCWLWLGAARRSNGKYGRLNVNGQQVAAHRYSWELANGCPVPAETIDHLCRNQLCVNPEHLEPVSFAENVRRACAAVTHCPKGHKYTEENTAIAVADGYPCRRCRACDREKKWLLRPAVEEHW